MGTCSDAESSSSSAVYMQMFEPLPLLSSSDDCDDDCDECVRKRGKRRRVVALPGMDSSDAAANGLEAPPEAVDRVEPPSTPQMREWCRELGAELGAGKVLEALSSWPSDAGVQLNGFAQLAEIAEGGPLWRAGAIGPSVQALATSEYTADVPVACKACAVLQCVSAHSDAAASDCFARGAVSAMASWVCRDTSGHAESSELLQHALSGLQALCANGSVLSHLGALPDLPRRLRAIVANANHQDASSEPWLAPARWLLEKLDTES